MRIELRDVLLIILGLVCTPTARATWMPADDEVPIDRLLSNLQQQLTETPDSHQLLMQIARVHSRAYALDETRVMVTQTNHATEGEVLDEKDNKLQLYEYSSVSYQSPDDSREAVSETRLSHLLAAIELYRQAAAHPEAGTYEWLGMGYTSREGARHVRRLMMLKGDSPDESDVEIRRQEFLEQSLQAYEKVFEEFQTKRVFHSNSVAHEAGS